MKTNFRVFTIHDPRRETAISAVYVGITSQVVPDTHYAAIFKKKLPDLHSAMVREKRVADVNEEAVNLSAEDARSVRDGLVAQYMAAGCQIVQGRRKSAFRPFRVVRAAAETTS